jgi:hypothetical protein
MIPDRPRWYRLTDDHQVVPAAMTERTVRRVALDTVGGYLVSTVFLGLDHGAYYGSPEPMVFETMIQGPQGWESWQERGSTWDEALAMHGRGILEAERLGRGEDQAC